jgi:hypothetical protein
MTLTPTPYLVYLFSILKVRVKKRRESDGVPVLRRDSRDDTVEKSVSDAHVSVL